jgi:GTP-binding protein
MADFSQTNTEIALFDPDLAQKPQLVAVNKMDLPEARERWESLRGELQKRGYEAFAVTAAARIGTRDVLLRAAQKLAELPALPLTDREIPVYRPQEDPDAFTIEREADGGWRVHGKRIERAAKMTYWEMDEAVVRFQKILETLGIYRALVDAGIQQGDMVYIGENELEWND